MKLTQSTPPEGRLLHVTPRRASLEAIARLNEVKPLNTECQPQYRKVQYAPLCPEGYRELWYPLGPLGRRYPPNWRRDLWAELRGSSDLDTKVLLLQDFMPDACTLLELIPGEPDLAALWALAHGAQAQFHLAEGVAVVQIGRDRFALEQDTACLLQAPTQSAVLRSSASLQTYYAVEKHKPKHMIYLAHLLRHHKGQASQVSWSGINCAYVQGRRHKRRLIDPEVLAKWLSKADGIPVAKNLLKSIRYCDPTLSAYASSKKYPGDGVRYLILHRYTQYYNQQKGITC